MKLPKLYIRDLFWLLVVVGMACGWFVTHLKWNRYLADLKNESYVVELMLKFQDRARQAEDYNYWITRTLKANGYSVQDDGAGTFSLSPALQPATAGNHSR